MKKMIMIGGIAVALIAVILVVVLVYLPSRPEKEKDEFLFPMEEMYTNIPLDDESGTSKILKLQLTIVYTDEEYLETLTKETDEIKDYLISYFRETTKEAIDRKNGMERVKEEITEQLIELLGAEPDNIRRVLLPQFIIQ